MSYISLFFFNKSNIDNNLKNVKFIAKKLIFFLKFDEIQEKNLPFLTLLVHFFTKFPSKSTEVLFEIHQNDP